MDHIETKRKIMALLLAAAAEKSPAEKAKKIKELDALLAQMMDATKEAAKQEKKVEAVKAERLKAFEKYAKILEPLKMYKSALQSEFMALREANAAKLGGILDKMKGLGAKGTAATDAVKARYKDTNQEMEPVGLDELLGEIMEKIDKVGEVGFQIESLAAEWISSGAWKPAQQHLDKYLKSELLNAKKEAEQKKAEFKKKVEELKKQQQGEQEKALLKQFTEELESAEAEAAAMEDAAGELGRSSSLQVSADDGEDEAAADAGSDGGIMAAIFDKADKDIPELDASLDEMNGLLDEIAAAAGSAPAPEAPSEAPAEEPAEAPADSAESPAEEEAPVEEMEMAAASLETQADDDSRDPGVMGDEPLPDPEKGKAKVQKELEKLDLMAKEVLKKFDSNKSQLSLINKLVNELKAKPELAEAVKKHTDAASEWSKAEKVLEDLQGQALELMKELEMVEHELPGKIKVWVETAKNRGLSEGDVEKIQNDADAFQGWAQKFLEADDNALLQETIESLEKGKEAVEEVHDASISIKDKPTYPPGTTDVVRKRKKEFEEKWKKEKEKAPAAPAAASSLNVSASDLGSSIDAWVKSFEDGLAKVQEFLGMMKQEQEDLESAVPSINEAAPAAEAPSEPNEMPSEVPEMAPAAAAVDDPWIREADVKQYPSEHDLSGGFWELIESEDEEGRAKLVINKDLRSRVTKKIKDMFKGAYKPGQNVCLDTGDRIVEASIKQYVGDGEYDVVAEGKTYRAPAKAIFADRIWR